MKQEKDYKVGDKVWFAAGAGDFIKGEIVNIFERYGIQFVIEVNTPIEPVYYVRNWDTISETKKGPLNFFQEFKNIFNFKN